MLKPLNLVPFGSDTIYFRSQAAFSKRQPRNSWVTHFLFEDRRLESPSWPLRYFMRSLILVYNGIRCLMVEAAKAHGVQVRRISFKGSVQALRQWEPHLNQATFNRQDRRDILGRLYESIAGKRVPERPGRSEPRAVKRRPKPYQLLTVPRQEMKETKHRGRARAKTP